MALVIAEAEWQASFPPRRMQAFPLLTQRAAASDDGIYTVNVNNFTSKQNWAARGYVTYIDDDNILRTVYTDQINVVDTKMV